MAVQQSTDKPEIRKKHTGLALASVIAINPSVEQAKALNLPVEKDTYVSKAKDKNDQSVEYDRIRFDIWLKTETVPVIVTKLTFFIGDRVRVNNNKTKTQFINKYGLSAWGDSVENMSGLYNWFSTDGIRPAFEGEEKFINFIRKWANTPKEGECQFENVKLFFTGNIKEIKDIQNYLSKNKVRVLLTVREGYQSVYDSYFESEYNSSTVMFKKHLEKAYAGEYKPSDDFQGTLLFKAFEESMDVEIKDAPTSLADTPSTPPNDLPF